MHSHNNSSHVIGYTTGVFDLFHVGHVNLLRRARSLCDFLIVGVTTDKACSYKGKVPVIGFDDRCDVVQACRYVDCVVPQENHDKLAAYSRYKFNVMFVGDDWYQSDRWKEYEEALQELNVRIVYFPYTTKTSSTLINNTLNDLRQLQNDTGDN